MWKLHDRSLRLVFMIVVFQFFFLFAPTKIYADSSHHINDNSAQADERADIQKGSISLAQKADLFGKHAKAGIAAHNGGKWSLAIAEFKAAYAINPNPKLLFNIAQAHRMAGNLKEALEYYERFRGDAPGSPLALEAAAQSGAMRARLEILRLDDLRTQAEQEARDKAAEAARLALINVNLRRQVDDALSAGELVKQRPAYRRGWFWGLLAGGAAVALGLGLGLGLAQHEPPIEPGLGILNVTF